MSDRTGRCSDCGERIGKAEVTYEATEFPYNPEWPIVRTDAARCCSDGCLLRYLARKIDGARDASTPPGGTT